MKLPKMSSRAKKAFSAFFVLGIVIVVILYSTGVIKVGSYVDILQDELVNSHAKGRKVIKLGNPRLSGASSDGSQGPGIEPAKDMHFAITQPETTIIDNRLGATKFAPMTTSVPSSGNHARIKLGTKRNRNGKLGMSSERRFPPNTETLLNDVDRRYDQIVISNAGDVDLLRPPVYAPTNAWSSVDAPQSVNGNNFDKIYQPDVMSSNAYINRS